MVVELGLADTNGILRLPWIDPNVLPFLPQWHYLHIHDEVLPYAREHGVTEEQIAAMLTANPRRLFEQAR